jgi:thioredoxin reductase
VQSVEYSTLGYTEIMTGETIDLAIVGSGPNGLYACYKFSKIFPHWNIAIFEKDKSLSANIRSYPNVKWHSTMADLKLPSALNSYIIDDINPLSQEIANYYQEFANEHKLPIRFDHELFSLNKSLEVIGQGDCSASIVLDFVADGEKTQVSCRYAILSTGIYSGIRKLSVQNRKIRYGYSLLEKKKNLVLVGAGNSAIDFIINLLPHNQITWILRGEQWGSIFHTLIGEFNSVHSDFKENLTIIRNATVLKFDQDDNMILSNGMVLSDFDACHVLIGYSPRNSLNDRFDFDFDNECLVLSSEFETSQSNVFAFGSLMATWDAELGRSAPTYVHNGNDAKLQVIIDSITQREVGKIFGPIKILGQHSQLNRKSKLRIYRSLIGKFLKNQTTFLYTKTIFDAVVKLYSKVKYLLKTLFTR